MHFHKCRWSSLLHTKAIWCPTIYMQSVVDWNVGFCWGRALVSGFHLLPWRNWDSGDGYTNLLFVSLSSMTRVKSLFLNSYLNIPINPFYNFYSLPSPSFLTAVNFFCEIKRAWNLYLKWKVPRVCPGLECEAYGRVSAGQDPSCLSWEDVCSAGPSRCRKWISLDLRDTQNVVYMWKKRGDLYKRFLHPREDLFVLQEGRIQRGKTKTFLDLDTQILFVY